MRRVTLALMLGLIAVGQLGCSDKEKEEQRQEKQGCAPPEEDLIALFGADRERALAQGREAAALVGQQDATALYARLSPELAQSLPEEQLRQLLQQTFASAPLGEPLGEAVASSSTAGKLLTYFQADYRWSEEEDLSLTFGFDPEGRIAELDATPQTRLPPDPYAGYRLQTRLRLPFAAGDTWLVVWGGPSRPQNYHVIAPDERHAYDLLRVGPDGRTHTGDGSSNDQYFCWDRPITAPADATVVTAEDGVRDNCPGVENPLQPAGNHVILDFGQGEYGLFAHLRQGSVQVSAGQQVKAGDLLGVCGNSGNSSQAHLHFHLQDGPVLGQARGLPVTFVDYVSNDQPVAEGTPVQGELIRLPTP
ncbi:MAG: peptidoglycan DD-metalloendopeptidase family protein [Myxococcaceae bacterium]|nr:peptidoglycan DD-metalloendopeptidase family protein [Myxococcaceae bacterium]